MLEGPLENFFEYDCNYGVGAKVNAYQAAGPEERVKIEAELVASIKKYVNWAKNAKDGLEFKLPVVELGRTLERFIDGKISLPQDAVLELIDADWEVRHSEYSFLRDAHETLKTAILRLDQAQKRLQLDVKVRKALNASPACLELKVRELEAKLRKGPNYFDPQRIVNFRCHHRSPR